MATSKEHLNFSLLIAIISFLIEAGIIGYFFVAYYFELNSLMTMLILGIINIVAFVLLLRKSEKGNRKKPLLICSLLFVNILVSIAYCAGFMVLLNALGQFFAV